MRYWRGCGISETEKTCHSCGKVVKFDSNDTRPHCYCDCGQHFDNPYAKVTKRRWNKRQNKPYPKTHTGQRTVEGI